MKKTTYWLLHLLLLLTTFTIPVFLYDWMYKKEVYDWLYIGVPLPFFLLVFWVLKINNSRIKIILLNILILFFITALAIITQSLLNKYKGKPTSETLFAVVLLINFLVLISATITQYLNKNKYLATTYLYSTIIVLILSCIIYFLWILNMALGSLRGAITG